MIITTTNNIEDYTIKQYLGVVNSNVVIGTNLFSDLTASLTDIFGGRSGTYKSKLDAIYNDVMYELKRKAKSLNADAILGLSIDFDEISGGGKSMFMVSASGTAVKILPYRYEKYKLLHEILQYRNDKLITEEEYEFEKRRISDMYKSKVHEETKVYLEEQNALQAKITEEIRIATKKAQEIEQAKSELSKISNCFESLSKQSINIADYSNIPIDESKSLDDIIRELIRIDRIPEACKYYMDETSLGENDAMEYIIFTYKKMLDE